MFPFFLLSRRTRSPEVTETEVRKEDVPPTMAADDEEMTKDAVDITIHVMIIRTDDTGVISTETVTLVIGGMIDDVETSIETIDHTKIVATLTGVVADILNLTDTSVRIAMTDVAIVGRDLVQKKNVMHATAHIRNPRRRKRQKRLVVNDKCHLLSPQSQPPQPPSAT